MPGLDDRITALRRAGFSHTAIAAILDLDASELQAQVADPSTPDPAVGGGGGLVQEANGAFGDPTVAPTFIGWFDDYNTVAAMDTTGMKAGTWALAYNANTTMPQLMVLDVDSGTFMTISLVA